MATKKKKRAFLSAVHRGDPCPFCLHRTDNVWPYCVHCKSCILDGLMGEDLRAEIDEQQNSPDEKGTEGESK